MSKVEDVARAMAIDDGTFDPDDEIDLVDGAVVDGLSGAVPFWRLFSSKARAAIAAMREPTHDMKMAFNDAFPSEPGERYLTDIGSAGWQAMIDAALAEEEVSDDCDDPVCVNAHDRCYGGAGGPCPYCEPRST